MEPPNHHHLKTWTQFFTKAWEGLKPWEVRQERQFRVGDTVTLHEWETNRKGYTGRWIEGTITYVSDLGEVFPEVKMTAFTLKEIRRGESGGGQE